MPPISQMSKEERAAVLAAAFDTPEMRERFAAIARSFNQIGSLIASATRAVAPVLQGIAAALRELPERLRIDWSEAAQKGWYPNSQTTLFDIEIAKDAPTLDRFMSEHIKRDWSELTEELVRAHPERAHILTCAFKLHREERYIASIPLFFSQADGIVASNVGAHLFTDHAFRGEKLAQLVASSDDFSAILYQVLGVGTQFGAGIRDSAPGRKALAPNRNGILHGSRRHLDYGNELNSLKAFSLLAFVSFAFRQRGDV